MPTSLILQHCDVLDHMQRNHLFRPITVQSAPVGVAWADIEFGLRAWKALGAKSIVLLGDDDPLLYRDGEKTISDVVLEASKPEKGFKGMDLALKVGVITPSDQPELFMNATALKSVAWIRQGYSRHIGTKPYPGGCWIGGLRPYWTSTGVYICTSHVLKTGKCEPEWKLCDIGQVVRKWTDMAFRMAEGKLPYDIDIAKCWSCHYSTDNELLHSVRSSIPEKDFA